MLLKWTPADFSSFKLAVHFEDYEAMRDPQWVLRNDSHERERERSNLSGKAGVEESQGTMFCSQYIRW